MYGTMFGLPPVIKMTIEHFSQDVIVTIGRRDPPFSRS